MTYPALAGTSSLKAEVLRGTDLIVRELTGGVYFAQSEGKTGR